MGKVTLVGAGPGDPGLLTVKGRQAILDAEVVVYDRLVGQAIFDLIPENAERIDVGKKSNCHPVPQWRINEILLEKAQEGKNVVRLKGGDCFLFGRGGEELELLEQHNISFEVVPGAVRTGIRGHSGDASGFHLVRAHHHRTRQAKWSAQSGF